MLYGSQWGGDGPVTMGVHLTNEGARTIEILSTGTAPGLTLLSTQLGDGELPGRLDPGESAQVISIYEITDCGLVDSGDVTWEIELQFADGPFKMRRQVVFNTADIVFEEREPSGTTSGWPAAISQYVCP